MVFLDVNSPPSAGDCTVESDGDETTVFNITCTDWYDGDGIASYTFYSKCFILKLYIRIIWLNVIFKVQILTEYFLPFIQPLQTLKVNYSLDPKVTITFTIFGLMLLITSG